MEKLSIFDMLAFAIPGGASMVIIYWTINNTVSQKLDLIQLPEALIAIILVFLAYFMGHLINEIAMKLEPKFGPMPKSWVEILEKNTVLAQNLNEISIKVFNSSFLAENGKVDVEQSDIFYDRAFDMLELNGKIEKVRNLQSQYIFFRNAVILSLLSAICFLVVMVAHLSTSKNIAEPIVLFSLVCVVLSLFAAKFSRYLSVKRRKMKMTATFNNFYAYYITENNFKHSSK